MKLQHLAAVPLLLVVLSGCGGTAADDTGIASAQGGATTQGGASAPTSTPTASPATDGLKFAQCMRDNGVEMPDPDPNGGKPMVAIDRSNPKLPAAMDKCKQYAPAAVGKRSLSPEDQKKMLAFTTCMRGQGVEMPDPDPNGGLAISGIKPNDPKFKKAMEACREHMPTRPKSS